MFVKNWGSPYKQFILLFFILSSCGWMKKDSKESRNDSIFWATDLSVKDIHLYSNDCFSQFIKDLVFEPICFYNLSTQQIQSSIVKEFRWVNDNELLIVLNENKFFHNSDVFSKGRGRQVTAGDLLHSLKQFQKYSKYQQTRSFLSNIKFKRGKQNNQLLLLIQPPLLPETFLQRLAVLKIPIIPSEINHFHSLHNFIGTGIYTIDNANSNFISLSIFKNHLSYITNKKRPFPERHLIQLSVPIVNITEELRSGKTDGVFTENITEFANAFQINKLPITHLFVRKEDEITCMAIRPAYAHNESSQLMNQLKKIVNPEEFNADLNKNQLISYYSNHELTTSDLSTLPHLFIAFENINEFYLNYVLSNIYENKLPIDINESQPDVIIYQHETPSNREEFLTSSLRQKYTELFGSTPERLDLVNQKIYQKAKYILLNKRVQMRNENFRTRNDFSSFYIQQ